jgi:hypothetical protein
MTHIWKNNKQFFIVGDFVKVKPKSEKVFVGQILSIDGNIISIGKDNNFYFNYHINQIYPNK